MANTDIVVGGLVYTYICTLKLKSQAKMMRIEYSKEDVKVIPKKKDNGVAFAYVVFALFHLYHEVLNFIRKEILV